MAWTGRATYSDHDSLPEDVSDIVTLLTPHETPLLNYLGDAPKAATNTKHEWLDEALNTFDGGLLAEADDGTETALDVDDGTLYQVGDQIEIGRELMLVTGISTNTLTVTREYGSSADKAAHDDNTAVEILQNAALEGADAKASRETSRTRRANYTQIFTETVSLSGTASSSPWIGVGDEYDHQKENRIKELLWQLERATMRGSTPGTTDVGSTTVRRTMQGIQYWISTNVDDASSATITAELLDGYLEDAWDEGARGMNLIMCNGHQKRRISDFTQAAVRYSPEGRVYKNVVAVYETDFGMFDVMLNHNMPKDEIWILNTDLIKVVPYMNRSFHHIDLGKVGDSKKGQVIGEYTLEFRNEASHVRIHTLAT